jgi:hypothetical protein
MPDDSNKEQLARVEKYAQAHFDRSYAISSGATKAAVAWVVALLIFWFQLLEPKLTDVRKARERRQTTQAASTLGRQARRQPADDFQKKQDLAKSVKVKLPFGIEFDWPPEWLVALWLALSLGLGWYLLDTRRRILQLISRGLRLLETEVKAEPPYVRKIVGNGVWWLAPLPRIEGSALSPDRLRAALGWRSSVFSSKTLFLCVLITVLVVIETRVFYVGFCVSFYLTPGNWLLITIIDSLLFAATLMLFRYWLAPGKVPDLWADEPGSPNQPRRRWALRMMMRGVIPLGALALLFGSTSAFAAIARIGKRQPSRKKRHVRRKRKRHAITDSSIKEGFYVNPRTSTVHTASRSCASCLAGVNLVHLVKLTKPDTEVSWNAPRAIARSDRLTLPPTFRDRQPPLNATDRFKETTPEQQDLVPATELSPKAFPATKGHSNGTKTTAPFTPARLHPHSTHRTYMVELVTLDLIRQEKGEEACMFLARALEATPVFGLRTSMRLFDLLAGISVRYNHPQYLVRLIAIANREVARVRLLERPPDFKTSFFEFVSWLASDEVPAASSRHRASRHHTQHHTHPCNGDKQTRSYKKHKKSEVSHAVYLASALEGRIKKWQDKNSVWYKKWADQGKPFLWACNSIA